VRALLLVLDSVGIGDAPDATDYGDIGANTLERVPELHPPNLFAGLGCRRPFPSIDRRDVAGYARALEQFDRWLGEFLFKILPDDLVIITADHGNDPTHSGTDHTREQVPLFVMHHREIHHLGTRETFADVAATLSDYFDLPDRWTIGTSLLAKVVDAEAS
jgi:phosphopentomutase